MADLDLVGEARVEVSSSGLDETLGKVDRLGAGLDGLVVSQDEMTTAQLRVNRALEATAKKYDAEYRALVELSNAMKLLERARSQELATTEAYARIQDNVTLKLQAQANAARLANEAQQKAADSIKGQAQNSFNSTLGVKDDFNTEGRAADIAAYGAALNALSAEFDPLFVAEQKYITTMERLQEALDTGAISQTVYAARVVEVGAAFDAAEAKLSGFASAQQKANAAQGAFNSVLGVKDDFGTAGRAADIEAFGKTLTATKAKYDPLFAAQEKYRIGLLDLKAAFAAGAVSQDVFNQRLAQQKAGFAEAINNLGLYSRAQIEAARSSAELEQAERNKARAQSMVDAKTTPGSSYSQADAEAFAKSFDDLQAKFDPLFVAERQHKALILEINEAEKVGAITTEQAGKATAAATSRLNNQRIEVEKADRAHASMSKSVGLNAYAFQNLSFQVNDVITSLASGISPFQTLAQQGGQIYQILQTSQGGVGGALASIKDRLLQINPLVGVFGTLAAALAFAAVAGNSFAKTQKEVQIALLGAGAGAGVSADQIQAIAERISATSKISIASAREIELAFVQNGKVYGEVFESGGRLADAFAKKLGVDTVEGAKQLAAALGDLGGGGLEKLAKESGNFDVAFEDSVRKAIRAGDDLKAMQMVIERVTLALGKAGEKATGFGAIWETVSRTVSNAYEGVQKGVGRLTQGPSLTDQLSEAQAARDTAIKVAKAADVVPDTSASDRRIKALNEALKEKQIQTDKDTASVRANSDAQEANLVKISPAIKTYKELDDTRRAANKVMSAYDNQKATGVYIPEGQYKAARQALDSVNNAIADYANANGAANAATAKAEAVEAARILTLKAITPAQQAYAASESKHAELLFTATSAEERRRQATEASTTVMTRARQATENLNRTSTESADGAAKLAGANLNTGNSVEYLRAQTKALAEEKAGTISKDEVENRTKVILREAILQEAEARSATIRAAKDETAVRQQLLDKQAAGKISSAEAAAQAPMLVERSKLQREALAATGDAADVLNVQLGALTVTQNTQYEQQKRSQTLNMTEDTNRAIELLEEEGKLIGLNNRERAIELAAIQAKQNLTRAGLKTDTPESVTYIDREKLKADLTYAKDQYQRMSQDITSALGGIFDDLTGSGKKNLSTFFDSFSKGFSKIGSRMVQENLLGPLVSGGLDGKGADGKSFLDKITGLFGGNGIEKAVAGGSEKGLASGIKSLGSDGGSGSGAFAKSSLGSILAPAAIGGSIGYTSQSPLVGGLGGAVAGFATGGPLGALAGGAAGILGGIFGASQAKKEAEKKLKLELQARKDALEQARPQIETLSAMLSGSSIGNVGKNIQDALSQVKAAAKTASDGGDRALADKLVRDYQSYVERQTAIFAAGFESTLSEVKAGFGVGGPFATAVGAVQSLGDALKGFVADAGRLSDPAAQQRARAAAVEGALGSLATREPLSATQTEMQRINGTAAGLTQVLKDLGLSADQAATAIKDRTNKALDALAEKFNSDLDRKINDAQGKDYLNNAGDLMKEVASLNADAASLGQDGGKVDTYFSASAQKIVDSSQLVGDAFNELIAAFPELAGRVHEYTADSKKSAAEMAKAAADALSAIQDRKRAYEDRAFAVNFSDNSLTTKLTAFERAAEWERWQEGAKGNQAIEELMATQDLERGKLIYDYQKAVQDRRSGYQDRQGAAAPDADTLGGKLAAQARQAARDRATEIEAGGDAINDLTRAQEAERAKIIRDYYEAVNNRIRSFQERTFAAADDESIGSKLAAFQRQAYQQQLDEAKAGGEAMGALYQAQAAEQQKLVRDYYRAVRERQAGFQDRAFAAGSDASSLSGQLAVFERQAQKDREAEIQIGGEAMLDLTRAQEAERAKIVRDYYEAVNQRILSFQDRLFAATNTSDLAGQLAAFDRSAAAERLGEIKSGGEALNALMAAQNAERQKLVDEYLRAIEERRGGYQDRSFAATNTNNLAGQLAAFERAGLKDRLAEIKAGGEAIADLTAAQEAERAKIIADYAAAVADRVRGYQDRTFEATNDATTLAGLLRAFDRKAAVERQAEAKAGGEAMIYLEQAQQAERLKVITDFNKQAKAAFDEFADTIKKFLDAMLTKSDSPLSPEDRLKAAQSQYDEQLKLAQGGDKNAMGSITTYAQTLLDASKAFFASSQAFQDSFNKIRDQLGKLPEQALASQTFGDTSTTAAVMAAIADQYTAPGGAANDSQPAMPQAPAAPGNDPILAELRALRAEVASLRGDVQENTQVTEDGALQEIAATRAVGAAISDGTRVNSRREVA